METLSSAGPSFLRERPLLEGIFLSRSNRFLGVVNLGGEEVEAHIADPGRLKEILIPGRKVYLQRSKNPSRKTSYDLVLVNMDGTLVSIDSRVPNELIFNALQRRFFQEFAGYSRILREVRYGKSRLDFKLTDGSEADSFIEVKSVTLVEEKKALFPDAPSIRGARHLRELTQACSEGYKAYVIFVIQRDDVVKFSPNRQMDPEFADALKDAVSAGVLPWAYTCRVTTEGLFLHEKVEVLLE